MSTAQTHIHRVGPALATHRPRSRAVGSAAVELTPEPVEQAEVEQAEADDEGFDPAAHTIEQVKEFVEANPDLADAVLEAELDGKNRNTLVAWLETAGETTGD